MAYSASTVVLGLVQRQRTDIVYPVVHARFEFFPFPNENGTEKNPFRQADWK